MELQGWQALVTTYWGSGTSIGSRTSQKYHHANYGHDQAATDQDGPIHLALLSVCERVAHMGAGPWLPHLAKHLDEYIQCCRWERVLCVQGKVPTFLTYSKLRLIVSAVYPCFVFAAMCIDGTATHFTQDESPPLQAPRHGK